MTFDEAPYKTGWESSGSDGVKAAEFIGLQGVPASYGEYIALVRCGIFNSATVSVVVSLSAKTAQAEGEC